MTDTYRLTPLRKIVNRVARYRVRRGFGPRHRFLLTVTDPATGSRRTTPVGIVDDGGRRWLVAPYGEVAWVRRARAAGRVTLERAMTRGDYAVRQVEAAEAGNVLKQYVRLEPITRSWFDADPNAPSETFAAEADRHPVFALRPLD